MGLSKKAICFLVLLLPAQSAQAAQTRISFARLAAELGILTHGEQSCHYSIEDLSTLQRQAISDDWSSDWACVMLQKELNRENLGSCLPDLSETFHQSIPIPRNIHGHFTFMRLLEVPYSYDVRTDANGELVVQVRIHFHWGFGIDEPVLHKMGTKLTNAAKIWNDNRPKWAPMRFQFLLMPEADLAHFNVFLRDGTGNWPYFLWGTSYRDYEVAHEVGHMMGLVDEYNNVRDELDIGKSGVDRDRCDSKSIMCNSNSQAATPQPYDYYLIARRSLCM